MCVLAWLTMNDGMGVTIQMILISHVVLAWLAMTDGYGSDYLNDT